MNGRQQKIEDRIEALSFTTNEETKKVLLEELKALGVSETEAKAAAQRIRLQREYDAAYIAHRHLLDEQDRQRAEFRRVLEEQDRRSA